jgi:nucleoid-associated protein YgaU
VFGLQAQDGVSPNLEEINISDSLNKAAPSPVAEEKSVENEVTTTPPPVAEPAPDATTAVTPLKNGEVDTTDSFGKTSPIPDPVKMTTAEQQDDLQSLKEDVGEVVFDKKPTSNVVVEEKAMNLDPITTDDEEKILKELSTYVKRKIPNDDWKELSQKSKIEKYEVQKGENLRTIAKKIFGSDVYYAKIWALNPQITNPHEIEPGTILSFDMGSVENPPNVQVGEFSDEDNLSEKLGSIGSEGEGKQHTDWIKERKKLIDQGVYFQFASEETYDDLVSPGDQQKMMEYDNYAPPITEFTIREPSKEYDSTGFEKNAKIIFNYKEGFFLNSFVTTNMLQDFGEVKATVNEGIFIHKHDTIYVTFDKSAKVKPGDFFSIYSAGGEIKHKISDRSGFIYTTTAQIKVIKNIERDLWECYVSDQSGLVQRNDRITGYTPRIGKISKTYGLRKVEAAIIGSFRDSTAGLSFGDVVYLDRGRADGLELGNTLELYSFVDRGTEKKISSTPTYKIGELNIINLTDNFSTAIISASSHEIGLGAIAFVKTQEEAARALKKGQGAKTTLQKDGKALEELDVELNLDDVNQDILNKADKIQLSEEEIEELDRQERDKSVIKDKERDVKELDRLESEILDSEKSLNESKVDEDKLLEQQNLDTQEKKAKVVDPNAFESINEIEKDIGRKYLDEDLNNKENPFGLTEYDLEEVDLLLNTSSKK